MVPMLMFDHVQHEDHVRGGCSLDACLGAWEQKQCAGPAKERQGLASSLTSPLTQFGGSREGTDPGHLPIYQEGKGFKGAPVFERQIHFRTPIPLEVTQYHLKLSAR